MAKEITIGRANTNNVVLSYPSISRKHASIRLIDQQKVVFQVHDFGSANGTFKNGERVSDAEFHAHNDRISIAHIDLKPSHFLPYFYDELVEAATPVASTQEEEEATPLDSKKIESEGFGSNIGSFFDSAKAALAFDRSGLPSYGIIFLIGCVSAWFFSSVESVATFYSLLGYAFVIILLSSATLTCFESMRRLSNQSDQQRHDLEIWGEKVSAARNRRIEKERSEHAWAGYRKFVISRIVEECDNIFSFYLAPHDKKPLPSFKPGQHLTFSLPIPGRTKPVVRCYSLSDSAVKKDEYRVTIKNLPKGRGGSNYFCTQLNEGDILDVKAPSGQFFLDVNDATPIVLIGGGIGVTPVLSMVSTLEDINSHRETFIFYGVRDSSELAHAEYLEQVVSERNNMHLHTCFSKRLESDGLDDNHHETRITVDFFKTIFDSNNYEFYMCGPGAMMNDITRGLEEWGVPPEHIHFENFGPATVKTIATVAETPGEAKTEYAVEFSKSGKTYTWNHTSGSLLDLARDNGITIESGCEAGSCGTCEVAIRNGDIEYMSEPGDTPEKGSCLVCIAKPKGPLTLDA